MCPQSKSTPWLALFFALLGLAWCGYAAFPTATPAPCATSGCALFRDSRVAGVSLWWVGGAYFFIQAILCLRGNKVLARGLAILALFADSVLLLIMFFTAPCFDCLMVALLIGLGYHSLTGPEEGWFQETVRPSVLLPVWFGLFLGNVALAGNEMLGSYTLGGADKPSVHLYFSPSCPACREALVTYGDKAVLYPVSEGQGDLEAIMRLEALLAAKVPVKEALARSLNPGETTPDMPFYRRWLLTVQLLRNKAALMRQGFRALPLIQINGMPGHKVTPLERAGSHENRERRSPVEAAWAAPYENRASRHGPAADPSSEPVDRVAGPAGQPRTNSSLLDPTPEFLDGLDSLKTCGGENAKPCE